MPYEIVFTADGSKALESLEHSERDRVRDKMNQIAFSEFRSPRDWDFSQMEGCAEGRFGIGDSLRVFADIDDANGVIRIHNVGRRENLYN